MTKFLKVFGYLWISLGGIVIVLGFIGAWISGGFGAVQELLMPTNFVNYIAMLVTLAPGLLALHWASSRESKHGISEPSAIDVGVVATVSKKQRLGVSKDLVSLELLGGVVGWIWIISGLATIYLFVVAVFFGGSWAYFLLAFAISIVAKMLTRGIRDYLREVL